ncbi:carbohydrate esterase family 4 protein [Mycena sp. CBHHK59/15]|nr:carbohydrate esterase family 4 protein [Mycena sp. CBHHK59/15]
MLPVIILAAIAGVRSAFTLSAGDAKATVYTNCLVDGTAAITLDDGPYKWIKNVSDTCTNSGANCTFFVNGYNWDCIYDTAQQDGLKYAYGKGHQIASHTWSHPDLTTLNQTAMEAEMDKVDLALQRILGVTPSCLRPPYGNYNDDVRMVAASRNKSLILWDFDSGDSTGSTPQQSEDMYDQAKASETGTLLALNHETSNTTVFEVLPYAIKVLQAYGYVLVTVAQCLGIEPYTSITEPGKPNVSWHC